MTGKQSLSLILNRKELTIMADKAEIIAAANEVTLEAIKRIKGEFDDSPASISGVKSSSRVETYTKIAASMVAIAEAVDTQDDFDE